MPSIQGANFCSQRSNFILFATLELRLLQSEGNTEFCEGKWARELSREVLTNTQVLKKCSRLETRSHVITAVCNSVWTMGGWWGKDGESALTRSTIESFSLGCITGTQLPSCLLCKKKSVFGRCLLEQEWWSQLLSSYTVPTIVFLYL